MDDSDLKKLLLETCPVRPGQEDRAWSALRDRLYKKQPRSAWSWLYYPTWRGLSVTVSIAVLVTSFWLVLISGKDAGLGLATADSQSPGIYATAFYSKPAGAQVVWLNGMDPASDKPTYLDPTTVVTKPKQAQPPQGDPNSL